MEALAKKDLAGELEAKCQIQAPVAEKAVDTLVEYIKAQLLRGNQVALKDFATLKIVEKKAVALTPRCSAMMRMASSRRPPEMRPALASDMTCDSCTVQNVVNSSALSVQFSSPESACGPECGHTPG